MGRIILTFIVTYIICIVWQKLELILYGAIQNREVDNIIMLIFIPIIYIALGNLN